MVFRSLPAETDTGTESETTTKSSSPSPMMASSAAKPPHHPLHNFSLQDLKWSMSNNSGNHHHHHHHRNSRHSSHKSDMEGNHSGSSSDRRNEKKSGTHPEAVSPRRESSEKKGKIFIRIKAKNSSGKGGGDEAIVAAAAPAEEDQNAVLPEETEEIVQKTWNLRPRRPMTKLVAPNVNGGGGCQEIKSQGSSRSELTRFRNGGDGKVGVEKKDKEKEKEKKKRLRFSIPLTKEEIEEDIFALTGAKPTRRPKKRAKHVQKQLDCVFPGMWLASITPDCYRVPEGPSKG